MRQREQNPYQSPQAVKSTRRSHDGRRLAVGAAIALGAALMYALFELQRAPYRPPEDMSTALGDTEILFVRTVIALIAIPWVFAVVHFIRLLNSR